MQRFGAPERVLEGDEALEVKRRRSVLRSDELRHHAGEVAGDKGLDVELRVRDLVQGEADRLVGRAQSLGEETVALLGRVPDGDGSRPAEQDVSGTGTLCSVALPCSCPAIREADAAITRAMTTHRPQR